jgi:fumarate hydratase class I
MPDFRHQPLFDLAPLPCIWRHLGKEGVDLERLGASEFLRVSAAALTELSRAAVRDASFLLRAEHNEQVARILRDPESSPNDRFVAQALLRNAVVAAEGRLPFCQDTGTAIVHSHKGQYVLSDGDDEQAIAHGIFRAYAEESLRYSQMAPLTMWEEKNTGTNLPAQIEIEAVAGRSWEFLFITKGGGSANKSQLFQETRAILEPGRLEGFLLEKMRALGTAACPPYHIAVVIGGTSAELCLRTVKLASARALDGLPATGNEFGRAFRDPELEERLLAATRGFGIGAQFGGTAFAHDVRVIRLPRHGASLPIGLGVSCSADRNIRARIDEGGLWLEQLDDNPGRWLALPGPARPDAPPHELVRIDLDRPMAEIRAELSRHPIRTVEALNGRLVVARDIAHARLKAGLDRGEGLPSWFKEHPVYYAGPAKTPEGLPSGSFGPTTAGRMDSYVDLFMQHGGSFVMIAKGNRSWAVTEACRKHGGFYLGSIGGPAALLAQDHIRSVRVLDFADLGMEAAWEIEAVDFPAVILVDDKGHDFFAELIAP